MSSFKIPMQIFKLPDREKVKRTEKVYGTSFRTYSNTWQDEVFIAGAGFAINGQFINRADNWENRAVGNAGIPGASS